LKTKQYSTSYATKAARVHLESIITFAPGVEPPQDDEETEDAVEDAEEVKEKAPEPSQSLESGG
jgi:hypothetical protein